MANNSFVFYESWSKFIDKKDRETAKEIVYQIYRIGLDKELDTDNEEIIDIIDAFILPNIKGAKRRYNTAVENGKKSKGRPPVTNEEQDKQIYQLHKDGWTYAQIAEEFGIDKNTVGNRVRNLREQEEELKTKNQKLNSNTETNIKTFITKDKNNSNSNKENKEDMEEDKEQLLYYNFN